LRELRLRCLYHLGTVLGCPWSLQYLFIIITNITIITVKLSKCLPCAALSWGQPTWQGLGFSGLVHEETHPCASNFIQPISETVQAGCINSVLVQTVPSVNDSICKKNISYYPCQIFIYKCSYYGHVPRKPLSLPSSVNRSLVSMVCLISYIFMSH